MLFGASIGLISALAFAPAKVEAGPAGFENLQGFATVAVNCLNAFVGTEKLPLGMGVPMEPSIVISVSPERVAVFDRLAFTLQAGRPVDATISVACTSGCPATFYDAFRLMWLGIIDEATMVRVDVPPRVLLGADASLPGRTLVYLAYAALESRPGGQVPGLGLLLNGGQAGLRVRPFSLLPPKGLRVDTGGVLGLRVRIDGGSRFVVTATDTRFARTLEVSGASNLGATLADVKRNYPGKEAVVLDVGDNATVGDVAEAAEAARSSFPDIVLGLGQPINGG